MSDPVSVDARPQPFDLDPAATAVIVVDMQNDFGSKGGMFDRAGIDIWGFRTSSGQHRESSTRLVACG